jgi:hypothetical protein
VPIRERPEQLTIDLDVLRDYLDDGRKNHADALALFQLGEQGKARLLIAFSGSLWDLTDGHTREPGQLLQQLHAMIESGKASQTTGLAYPGVFVPGATVPGAGVEGFFEKWKAVLAIWKSSDGKAPGWGDALWVETHVLVKGDYFITRDAALLAMCRRLHDEHDVSVRALRSAEYLAR